MTTNNSPKTNLVLTGFMGTGKTTIGRLLAGQLGYEFVDTDVLIEERQGRTIPEIFAELGEAAFRRMEAELAVELGRREGLVISTGGRLMLDPANAAALGRRGRVFCLVASPEEILRRLQSDTDHPRPLLAGDNPGERIAALLAERAAGYGRFRQVDTSGRPPQQVAAELLALFATATQAS
ncbi:MAG: shikimate kinase [Anaerolineae bacterium]